MIKNSNLLDELIVGYVPHKIYAFSTPQAEKHLKVGETSRSVAVRLKEWRTRIIDLNLEKDWLAMLPKSAKEQKDFFQDFALHKYFEDNGLYRLPTERAPGNSKEFFPVTLDNIEDGIDAINQDYISDPPDIYNYLSIEDNSRKERFWARTRDFAMRKNQEEVIEKILAVKSDAEVEPNYLLFAVMRFGKTFVALQAAKALEANLTVVVSAKADVKGEWKENLDSHKDFEGYVYIDSSHLDNSDTAIDDTLKEGKAVLFLTLQDLRGNDVKVKHKQLFNQRIDLLIIDESHFGARAQSYGHKIKLAHDDEKNDEEKGLMNVEALNVAYKLHLSGTPYRILMGDEFNNPKQIVGKIQFEDILQAKELWYKENLDKPEWENPYFGFPQLIRFAFNLSESAKEKIKTLTEVGATAQLNEIFSTKSNIRDESKTYLEFKYFDYVLSTIKALDGADKTDTIFPILDYPQLKSGKMAQHIVMVLPYRASCDAMAKLLTDNQNNFTNLKDYEIINIAGLDSTKTVEEVKIAIKNAATDGKKTISLTVNKMLTGVTVPQWDTMIYLKGTQSPQEYDQAVYRLQSPYVTTQVNENNIIVNKEDLKPQTLLIDFAPTRMMSIEQYKAFILSASDGESGNDKVKVSLERQMTCSPIITVDNQQLTRVTPADVLKYIAAYSSERGIIEEASQISIDLLMLNNDIIKEAIDAENEINSKAGIKFENTDDGENTTEEEFVNSDNSGVIDEPETSTDNNAEEIVAKTKKEEESTARKIRNYYLRILFYAFLSKEKNINNLSDVIATYDNNERLAKHLGLKKNVLEAIKNELKNPWIRSDLDNKISNASSLLSDDSLDPSEKVARAIRSFSRISESEVFTPRETAESMSAYIIREMDLSTYNEQPQTVIDIASKSGIYLLCMEQKLLEKGCKSEIIRNNLFAITTSAVAYEFTRKVYELMDWNVDNLIKPELATSYDLIDSTNNTMEKVFDFYKSKNKGDFRMNFDIVVGNPPYQDEAKGTSSSDDPIYHLFMEVAYKIADRVSLITPARFLFNAGKTPKEWNEKMLNDEHLRIEHYVRDSTKVFMDAQIPGGVVVTYRDKMIDFGCIGKYTGFEQLDRILKRVKTDDFISIQNIIYPQNKFNLDVLYSDYPQYLTLIGSGGKDKRFRPNSMEVLDVFTNEKQNDDDIKVLGLVNRSRTFKYIPRRYVEQAEWIDKYKVLVSASNGASGALGDNAARLISKPELGHKFTGFTQTFIGFGQFDTINEAENLLKYINTKFARVLLGILKVTPRNTSDTWEYVPLQNFTQQSDIDWTKSITDIDRQLYHKYELDQDEIDFIEEKVKLLE